MWWLRNSIICSELVETEKPRIEVSPSLFARDCTYVPGRQAKIHVCTYIHICITVD